MGVEQKRTTVVDAGAGSESIASRTLTALSDAWQIAGIIAEIAAATVGTGALVFVAFGYFQERDRTDEARADAADSRLMSLRALEAAEHERNLASSALVLAQRQAAHELTADLGFQREDRPASTFGHPSPYLGSLHNLGPGRAADVSVRPADVQHVRDRMSADNRLSACRNLLGSEVPYIAARLVYHGAIDLLPDCDDPLMASVVVTWTDGNGERMQKFKIPLNHDLV